MSEIINPSDLVALYKEKECVIIDARAGADARRRHEDLHLTSARFVDVETELAQKTDNAAQGGRHSLPSVAYFARILGSLGIKPESHVIVYDDKNASNAAARFWWMLKAVGHKHVQVINGGFQGAIAAGFPTQSGLVSFQTSDGYPAHGWLLPTAEIEAVAQAALDSDHVVIDVRDSERYKGIFEPIDLIAGHIAGAINIPFTENLDFDGFFLPSEQLKEKYELAVGTFKPENIIVHCGSGVTACHTLLTFAHAGLPIPKLYVGSWSEWSRNDRAIGQSV